MRFSILLNKNFYFKLFLAGCLLLLNLSIYAQINDDLLPEESLNSHLDPDEIQVLNLSAENKLDLNLISLTQFKALHIIPDNLADSIFSYKNRYGYFHEFWELNAIEGMNSEYLQKIQNYFFVEKPSVAFIPQGKNELLISYTPFNFNWDSCRLILKYKGRSWGILIEKDPIEPFNKPQSLHFNFYKSFVFKGVLKKIIIGNTRLLSTNKLIQAYSFLPPGPLTAEMAFPVQSIRHSLGTNELFDLKGVSMHLEKNKHSLSIQAASQFIKAYHNDDGVKKPYITNDKYYSDAIIFNHYLTYAYSYRLRNFILSHALSNQWDSSFKVKSTLMGADLKMYRNDHFLSVDFAYDIVNKAHAKTIRYRKIINKKNWAQLDFRDFSNDYTNNMGVYCKSFSEGIKERGFSLGYLINFLKKSNVWVWMDKSQSFAPSYRLDFAHFKNSVGLTLNHYYSANHIILRFRYYEVPFNSNTEIQSIQTDRILFFKGVLTLKINEHSKFRCFFSSAKNFSDSFFPSKAMGFSFLSQNSKWNWELNYVYFNANNFKTRLYTSERAAPHSFGSHLLYGSGNRVSCFAKYKWNTKFNLGIKCSINLMNAVNNSEINENQLNMLLKNEVALWLIYKWN